MTVDTLSLGLTWGDCCERCFLRRYSMNDKSNGRTHVQLGETMSSYWGSSQEYEGGVTYRSRDDSEATVSSESSL